MNDIIQHTTSNLNTNINERITYGERKARERHAALMQMLADIHRELGSKLGKD
jgi:hypothetical protein